MFPIGDDDVRGGGKPWITWLLVGINIVVFIYELTLMSAGRLEEFMMTYGVVPAQIAQGQNLLSLLTSMFLHGSWAHVFSNMLFLWIFGNNIEATLGKAGYIIFYIAGGLAASAAHIAFNLQSQVPTLGASGAVAAVLGAYVVMYPQSHVRLVVIFFFRLMITRVIALVFIGFWFLTQFFNSVASLGVRTAETGGVAYLAHVGGFILGLIVGALFRGRRLQLTRSSSSF